MDDRQPEALGDAVKDGFREGAQQEVRAWGRCAKWGGLAGGLLGAVVGVAVFGASGVGVGLLIGIPGGALVACVLYLAISSAASIF